MPTSSSTTINTLPGGSSGSSSSPVQGAGAAYTAAANPSVATVAGVHRLPFFRTRTEGVRNIMASSLSPRGLLGRSGGCWPTPENAPARAPPRVAVRFRRDVPKQDWSPPKSHVNGTRSRREKGEPLRVREVLGRNGVHAVGEEPGVSSGSAAQSPGSRSTWFSRGPRSGPRRPPPAGGGPPRRRHSATWAWRPGEWPGRACPDFGRSVAGRTRRAPGPRRPVRYPPRPSPRNRSSKPRARHGESRCRAGADRSARDARVALGRILDLAPSAGELSACGVRGGSASSSALL